MTIGKQFALFTVRWLLNTFGLWLSVRLFTSLGATYDERGWVWTFLIAGLVFSIVNSLLKPVIMILSLPAILLTLGLFMLIVNGLMVYVSVLLVPGLEMPFVPAILAGIVLSLINYIISGVIDLRRSSSMKGVA